MCNFILHEGDCQRVMPGMAADSIDLIMTSPPYAHRREAQYGGIPPDEYVDWFMPISEQMQRVLKPSGSLVLNIHEHCEDGERHPYVMELVLAIRRAGWKLIEQYIWHKTNPMPRKPYPRLKNQWEPCFHFRKEIGGAWYPDAVKTPLKEVSAKKYQNATGKYVSATGSGFNGDWDKLKEADAAYPGNVISTPNAVTNVGHPAAFPPALPEFFIKLTTMPGDVVLDPFAGSGTTIFTAYECGRRAIGIEKQALYCELIRAGKRVLNMQLPWEGAIDGRG